MPRKKKNLDDIRNEGDLIREDNGVSFNSENGSLTCGNNSNVLINKDNDSTVPKRQKRKCVLTQKSFVESDGEDFSFIEPAISNQGRKQKDPRGRKPGDFGKPSVKYVFTSELANFAVEAVFKRFFYNIIHFHACQKFPRELNHESIRSVIEFNKRSMTERQISMNKIPSECISTESFHQVAITNSLAPLRGEPSATSISYICRTQCPIQNQANQFINSRPHEVQHPSVFSIPGPPNDTSSIWVSQNPNDENQNLNYSLQPTMIYPNSTFPNINAVKYPQFYQNTVGFPLQNMETYSYLLGSGQNQCGQQFPSIPPTATMIPGIGMVARQPFSTDYNQNNYNIETYKALPRM